MKLGIFARTFPTTSVGANLDAVAASGFALTQYNLICAGLPTLPNKLPKVLCEEIRTAHLERGLSMAAISATFNIIDPDPRQRDDNLRKLFELAHVAAELGTDVLTLCSGTCDAGDMWAWHPNNASLQAWHELEKVIKSIVRIAETCDVTMAVEPERNNVVSNAEKALRLVEHVGSEKLKIVLDGANLIDSPDPNRMRDVLDETIELLGPHIVLAHAKDVVWQRGPQQRSAGKGMMDYAFYLRQLKRCGFRGPLILHGLRAEDVFNCRKFLHEKLTALKLACEVPLQGNGAK